MDTIRTFCSKIREVFSIFKKGQDLFFQNQGTFFDFQKKGRKALDFMKFENVEF